MQQALSIGGTTFLQAQMQGHGKVPLGAINPLARHVLAGIATRDARTAARQVRDLRSREIQPTSVSPFGELAEWLRSGLQIRVHRFDSGTRLHISPVQSPSPHDPCSRQVEPAHDPSSRLIHAGYEGVRTLKRHGRQWQEHGVSTLSKFGRLHRFNFPGGNRRASSGPYRRA